jgi:peptidyl-prolyl cis-trans isomerase C
MRTAKLALGAVVAMALAGSSVAALAQGAPPTAAAPAPKAAPAPAADDQVAAVVNGEKIYRSEAMQVYAGLPEQYKQLPPEALYTQIVQRLVERKLLAQAAEKAGYADKPDVKRRIASDREQILQDAFLVNQVESQLTDARLKQAYEKKVAAASKELEVHARHVLLKSEADAKAVIAELDKGVDFATLAKTRSTGPTAANGGDLGFFTRDQMVKEFADAAFALKPGEYTRAPVHSQFGWHVIKVEGRRAAKVPSFEESKEELKNEAARTLVAEIVAKARSGAEVTIVPPTSGPAGHGGIRPVQ